MTDLMLDLEALNNTKDSAIVQIGAVYFDREGNFGEEFHANIDLKDALKYGSVGGETLQWWFEQSQEAQKSLFTHPRLELKAALKAYIPFAKGASKIWSHATFDFVILENAFKSAGLWFPHPYTSARDIRTLMDITGTRATKNGEDMVEGEILHNAISDCKRQIRYCVRAIKKLKEG